MLTVVNHSLSLWPSSSSTCWAPTISLLTLAYRCSEENIDEEYYNDYDEFWGMRSPSQVPVEPEDGADRLSYRYSMLKTFESTVWV
jgi:hypothetical protein